MQPAGGIALLEVLEVHRLDTVAEDLREVLRAAGEAAVRRIKIEADALKVNLLTEITRKEAEMVPPQEPVPGENPEKEAPVLPEPKPKKRKIVSIKTVTSAATWQLETQEDVQRYVTDLQNKLNGMLQENTILNIEF